jgi:cytochrome c oxidase subunit I+III
VLTVLMFTSRVEGKRFMDVYENSDYWYFVIWTWLPVYATIYLAPRLL